MTKGNIDGKKRTMVAVTSTMNAKWVNHEMYIGSLEVVFSSSRLLVGRQVLFLVRLVVLVFVDVTVFFEWALLLLCLELLRAAGIFGVSALSSVVCLDRMRRVCEGYAEGMRRNGFINRVMGTYIYYIYSLASHPPILPSSPMSSHYFLLVPQAVSKSVFHFFFPMIPFGFSTLLQTWTIPENPLQIFWTFLFRFFGSILIIGELDNTYRGASDGRPAGYNSGESIYIWIKAAAHLVLLLSILKN